MKNETGPLRKQMQILELLNEICEEADEHKNDDEHGITNDQIEVQQQQEVEAETEIEETKIIDKIMQVFAIKGDGTDTEYQSLTYTDGIYLQSISGDNLEIVI